MTMTRIAAAAALTLAASSAMAGVFPASTGTCSFSDVSIGGVNATACRGFFDNNLNNNADYTGGVKTYLETAFSVTLGASIIDQINTGTDANFSVDLGGDVVVGVHWGGQGGGNTAFYFFDNLATTTANVDPVNFNPTLTQGGGLSNVALYLNTGDTIVPGIPEPSTYALMFAGLGAMALVARRRRNVR